MANRWTAASAWGGGVVSPATDTDRAEIRDRIQSEIVPSITDRWWMDVYDRAPLETIGDPPAHFVPRKVSEHSTYSDEPNGVYVLECRRAPTDGDQKDWKSRGYTARRRIYVGRSVHVPRRIEQHICGTGSKYTTQFPPARILNISWWDTKADMKVAEPEIAKAVDEAFPEDHVQQW